MDLPWLQPQQNASNSGMDIAALIKKLQEQQTPQPGANLRDIIKFGAGAQSNFQGIDTGPQEQAQGELNHYANAMTDETDPMFQQVYGQEKQQGQQDLAHTIFELSNQNRKLSELGRTPLFDPERGGEQQFRQLSQGYQDVQNSARGRAREIIGAGMSAKGKALDAQNELSALKEKNRTSKTAGIGNLADALPFLLKFL